MQIRAGFILGLFWIFGILAGLPAMAQSQQVNGYAGKALWTNGNPNPGDADAIPVTRTENTDETPTFTPPGDATGHATFINFPGLTTAIDVLTPVDAPLVEITADGNISNPPTDASIHVLIVLNIDSAAQYIMVVDGNLGGKSVLPVSHWAAKESDVFVQLALSTAATLSPQTENDKHDDTVDATGSDKLEALPIGTGAAVEPFKDKSYVCLSEMIGTVIEPQSVADAQALTLRFRRFISYRAWSVIKLANNNVPIWGVFSYGGEGTTTPQDDDKLRKFDDSTPSATKKIYACDASGISIATPPFGTFSVGDFIICEKTFIYTAEVQKSGTWVKCGQCTLYQRAAVTKIAATGTVAQTWKGLGNSYSNTPTDLLITAQKVHSITGVPLASIKLDGEANMDYP